MFFKEKKNMNVGKISLGNILCYTYGKDENYSYTSIYTDKDISVMFYCLCEDITKDTKIYLHCSIKNDKPIFSLEIEGYGFNPRTHHINMTLHRFNKFFEEEKLKGV